MPFPELQDLHTHFPVKGSGLFSKSTETIRAVNGVSLKIEKGEILGLVGESGCGKSTLSRTVMQLQPATSGKVILNGEELTALPKKEIRQRRLDFQMIFQDPYASLNPRGFLNFGRGVCQRYPKLKKIHRHDKVTELMSTVGLAGRFMKKYPHEFSGGQRQRIAIARALAPEPKLVIADEPVSALDVSIQSQILNLLLELRDKLELTMIFISHDLSVVRYLADNIAVMHSGQIVEYGEAEDLFHSPKDDYTKKLLSAIPQPKATASA